MDLLVIIFFIAIIFIFILMFGILFFVSGIGKIIDFISMIVFRNHEDCSFCNCKNSMRIIKTSSGYKKVCNKCKFSIEVDNDKKNDDNV
ncbi:hypothetical protein A9X84_07630 [Brachyspira hyodysenteriae]|uniref:hypothetical protein n=1 Tax=Brachyspira hyodysenteriae TaxID=159 RepID=UPI001183F757|nr:hypothetical protein [Brachyspira hyodysenteriae]TVL43937.1 hypothetical protein A9X84_07630 [Brachyspira hyodysenteriae]